MSVTCSGQFNRDVLPSSGTNLIFFGRRILLFTDGFLYIRETRETHRVRFCACGVSERIRLALAFRTKSQPQAISFEKSLSDTPQNLWAAVTDSGLYNHSPISAARTLLGALSSKSSTALLRRFSKRRSWSSEKLNSAPLFWSAMTFLLPKQCRNGYGMLSV